MANYYADVTFVDGDGQESHVQYFMENGTLLLMQTNLTLALQSADAITLGVITDINVWEQVEFARPNGLKVLAGEGANRKEGGLFAFRTAGGFATKHTLPTYDNENHASGRQILTTTSQEVENYINAITGGGFTDYRGDDIATFVKGYKTFGGKQA